MIIFKKPSEYTSNIINNSPSFVPITLEGSEYDKDIIFCVSHYLEGSSFDTNNGGPNIEKTSLLYRHGRSDIYSGAPFILLFNSVGVIRLFNEITIPQLELTKELDTVIASEDFNHWNIITLKNYLEFNRRIVSPYKNRGTIVASVTINNKGNFSAYLSEGPIDIVYQVIKVNHSIKGSDESYDYNIIVRFKNLDGLSPISNYLGLDLEANRRD